MKVEHVSTNSKKLLPRMWWNSEANRGAALGRVKQLLDGQEVAWNAMVGMWERSGEGQAPPRSPQSREQVLGEKIRRFP
ncbi:MAG: hypothetical protein WC314_20700 [Vulcanimicrobiota bacterium]